MNMLMMMKMLNKIMQMMKMNFSKVFFNKKRILKTDTSAFLRVNNEI
jgi:hypothetical protein